MTVRVFTAALAATFLLHTLPAEAGSLPARFQPKLTLESAEEVDPFLQPVITEDTAEIEALSARRSQLKWHQGFGLAALGLTTAQVVLGQVLLNRQNDFLFDSTSDTIKNVHLGLGIASFLTYGTAAALAFTAPEVEGEGDEGSLVLHKSLAVVHGIGMLVSPFLGLYISDQSTSSDPTLDADQLQTLRTVHQVTGYTTVAALFGAALVIVWD